MASRAEIGAGLLRHPMVYALLLATLGALLANAIDSEGLQRFVRQPESLIEHVSHLVLAAGVVAWIGVAVRIKGSTARLVIAVVVAAYVALLLMEELRYGGVYGLNGGRGVLYPIIGKSSLHQSSTRAATVFHDMNFWFALPVLFWFTLPRLPIARLRAWSEDNPLVPTAVETIVLWLILITYCLIDALAVRKLMDFYQTLTYGLLAVVGWRAWRQLGTSAVTEACPAPRSTERNDPSSS